MRRAALSLLCGWLSCGCAGGHGKLTFDELRYPVSLSPTVADAEGQILDPERLEVVGELLVQTKAWGILYSTIPTRRKRDVSGPINQQIAADSGEGVVNLRIVSEQCAINYAWVISALPFWPGCSDVTLTGDIVRVK